MALALPVGQLRLLLGTSILWTQKAQDLVHSSCLERRRRRAQLLAQSGCPGVLGDRPLCSRKMLLSGEALLSGSPVLAALSDPWRPLQAGVCLVPSLHSWWLQWIEQLPPPTMVTASQVAGSPQGSGVGGFVALADSALSAPSPS